MESAGRIIKFGYDITSNSIKMIFEFKDRNVLKKLESLDGLNLNIKLEQWYSKRSLNANAYMWQLIGQLAKKMNLTNNEVYRKHIKEAGSFTVLQMEENEMKAFERIWQSKGLGWICEKSVDRYGQIVLLAFHGSSIYTTKEMARLIDSVVQDCREQGIETKTNEEINSLLKEWDSEQKKQRM